MSNITIEKHEYWWASLTPLQRIVIAVLRAAMMESAKERKAKQRFEEAIYGREDERER